MFLCWQHMNEVPRVWEPSELHARRGSYPIARSMRSRPSRPLGDFDDGSRNVVAELQDSIGRNTSVEDIIEALSERGCRNLTSLINPEACSDHPYAGGGNCDVYRGELLDGTKVAIKCLRVYHGPNAENERCSKFKRAAKEIYGWSKLRHPNVMRLLGLAQFRGYLSMVSEWMEHGDLSTYLRRNPTVDRNRLCVDVCSGLNYMHDRGMVHGDLKAANVLVSPEGRAMLTDFGSAHLSDPTLMFTTGTKPGFTTRWAAPELVHDFEEVAPKCPLRMESDVYALGMTIMEILTGKIPYEGRREVAIPQLIARERYLKVLPYEPVTDTARNRRLSNIAKDCWAWKPDERPDIKTIMRKLLGITHSFNPHELSVRELSISRVSSNFSSGREPDFETISNHRGRTSLTLPSHTQQHRLNWGSNDIYMSPNRSQCPEREPNGQTNGQRARYQCTGVMRNGTRCKRMGPPNDTLDPWVTGQIVLPRSRRPWSSRSISVEPSSLNLYSWLATGSDSDSD